MRLTNVLQITMNRLRYGSSGTVKDDLSNNIYGVMVIIIEKMKYVEIRYNTDNIQMLCVTNVSYSTFTLLKIYVQSDQQEQKIN